MAASNKGRAESAQALPLIGDRATSETRIPTPAKAFGRRTYHPTHSPSSTAGHQNSTSAPPTTNTSSATAQYSGRPADARSHAAVARVITSRVNRMFNG
ncbi:hypothetical protein D3C75_1135340 [compost metagenome]